MNTLNSIVTRQLSHRALAVTATTLLVIGATACADDTTTTPPTPAAAETTTETATTGVLVESLDASLVDVSVLTEE